MQADAYFFVLGLRVSLNVMVAVLLAISGLVACGGAGGSLATSAPANTNPNLIGINIAAPLDWEENRLYADVASMSRPFVSGLDPNIGTPALVDASGWPTSDFSFYVWAGIGQMHGIYTLSFQGQASVSGNPIGNIPIAYDPATNTSTGTFQYTNTLPSYLALSFAGTKRVASSISGSGVTSIKIMRPLTPGSAQSYPALTLFTNPIKALISKFSVIRFMDYLGTNANAQINWSERALPSWPSFQRNPGAAYGWQGIGGPWEHVILLMNETGKNAWINIPVNATDAYIRNVALMFAYGSDGFNPYPSPQANPVYPPLNANLKVYVEYSNELWNFAGGFTQFHDNCQAASAELASTAGISPLNWDNTWNTIPYNRVAPGPWNWIMCNRHTAKRSVEISNIFRSVFGDAAMIARIRPVLMSQLGYPGAALFDETKMMLEYYNNLGSGGNFVVIPHPPNYYFYGAGGSGYYGAAITVSTLDALFADPGMTSAGFAPALRGDAGLVAAMGLKRTAYEGGPSLDKTLGVRDAISAQAVNDARMTTALVNMHNAWSSNGGELLVYYQATGDYQWGFTSDLYNLSTPKLLAIDALNAVQRTPLILGTPVPGNIAGNVPGVCSRGWGCNPIQPYDCFTADGSKILWASYSFRSSGAATWTVNLSFANPSGNASAAVYVDGILVGTQTITGGALSFPAGTVGAGLHGVVVRAVTGIFTLSSVTVALN